MRRKIAPAPITNAQIADSFDEIAHLLELQLANPFRLSAYRRAADRIRNWPLSLAELYRSGGLAAREELPGIGSSLAKKIAELVKRGRLRFLDRLRRKATSADALLNLPTVGPVLANRIRGKLGASNLEEVFRAAQDGRLRRVDGIGDKGVRASRPFMRHHQGCRDGAASGPEREPCGVRKLLFLLLLIAPILTTITPICASNAHG